MTSLTEVYEGRVRAVAGLRRLYFGGSLFAVGVAMVVGSIAVATTGLGELFGLGVLEARELAGVLAGLGVPASLLGVFAVLPSGRVTRAASLIGASVTVLGVALFREAYPYQWLDTGGGALLLVTVTVYFFGVLTTLSCLFVGLATFKTRNDPGGTAKMKITEEGQVRLVEEESSFPSFGSVGLFGRDPDGEVSTQTNRHASQSSQSDRRVADAADATDHPSVGGTATADGGSATVVNSDATDDDAAFIEEVEQRGRPDAYCGNCDHFEYVKVEEKIVPRCGLHEELMEDMDACDDWTENT